MSQPLRVGIIGLGRRWRRRYRPALLALRQRFLIQAVCDQVRHRADREARRLDCRAATGPAALLEGDDLDAVLLLDGQWFGLWPLELACRARKPVFCSCPLEVDEAHADSLYRQVQDSRLPVMVELAPRTAPATDRLRHLLATQLGPARLLLCESAQSQQEPGGWDFGPPPPGGVPGALLDWCASLLGGEPVSVLAGANPSRDFTSLFLEFSEDRAVQVNRRRVPGGRPCLGLKVVAERGAASVDLPDRVRWSDADGRHTHTLRGHPPLGQVLLEQFHDAVTAGRPPQPDLAAAYRTLAWLRAADRSLAEGRRVPIPVPSEMEGGGAGTGPAL